MKRFLLAALCVAALNTGCGADERGAATASPGPTAVRAEDASTPTNAPSTSPGPSAAPAPVAAGASAGSPDTKAPPLQAAVAATAAAPASDAGTAAPAAGVGSEPPVVPPKPPVELAAPVQEVVRLALTSVGDDVIVAYVESVAEPIRLNADQIIYLRDVGVSMPVIQALLKHGAPESAAVPNATAKPAPAGQPTPATPAPAAPAAPAAAAGAPGSVAMTTNPAAFPGGPQAGTPAVGNAALAAAAPIADAAPVYGPGPSQVQAPAVATAPAPPPVTDSNYFYESLSPYGNWVQVENYGWCWQPSVAVVNAGWQPYCDQGHWLWTDNGWYWNSYYSWGWAPFHYGRWHRHHHHGWVWYPGTVWGPAWVTWRYSDAYCGWAPLPPEAVWDARLGLCFGGVSVAVGFGWGLGYHHYSYVPFDHFCHREVWHHRVPAERNVTIVNNTTIVNNYNYRNKTIINGGLDKGLVERRSRGEIRKVAIQETSQPTAASRLRQEGGRPVAVNAYRPNLPAQASAPPRPILARQEAQKASLASPGAGGVIPGRPTVSPGIRSAPPSRSQPGAREATTGPSRQPTGSEVRDQILGGSRPTNPNLMRPADGGAPPRGAVGPRTVSPPPNPSAPAYGRPQYQTPAGRPTPPPSNQPGVPSSPSPGRTEIRKPEAAVSPRPSLGAGVPGTGRPQNSSFAPETTRVSPSSSTLNGTVRTAPTPSYRTDTVRPPSNFSGEPAQRGYGVPQTRTYTSPTASTPEPSRSYGPTAPQRAAPPPVYTAPTPRAAPAPSYSPPIQRTAPVPSYSPPVQRTAPVPSYTPPVQRSTPAPSAPATQPRQEGGSRPSGPSRNAER